MVSRPSLLDIPKDTPNLLAWNGGGCNNYTAIIEAGSYKVDRKAAKADAGLSVSDLEEAIEHDFKVVSGQVVHGLSSFSEQAEKFAKKIQSMVDAEVKDFLEELSS